MLGVFNRAHTRINYRKDIDGLRAVAVLSVIFYHLNIPLFQSGFLGVDVFFVISGYLITEKILQGIDGGHFTLRGFYLKRIRRIYPALLFLLLITSIVAYFVLVAGVGNFHGFTESLFVSVLGVSNLYFGFLIPHDYFSPDMQNNPLMHTWSLGVEEQFYLCWPIFLIFMHRVSRRQTVFIFTLMLMVVSFLFFYHFRYNQKAFYFTGTRAFELLMGAAMPIGVAKYKNLLQFRSRYMSDGYSIVGLILLLGSMILLPPHMYPGFASLLPCVGSLILIQTSAARGFVNRCLSLSVFVNIGLLSYSLYLCHWPIICFAHHLGYDPQGLHSILLLTFIFLLSFISWRLIELPFRFIYQFGFMKTLFLYVIVPLYMAVALFGMSTVLERIGYHKIVVNKPSWNDYYGPYKDHKCIDSDPSRPATVKKCSFGNIKKDRVDVILVGDSHAMSYVGMLNALLSDAGMKGYIVTQSASPFFVDSEVLSSQCISSKSCLRNQVITSLISNQNFLYVVLAGFWNSYPDFKFNKHTRDRVGYQYFKLAMMQTIEFIFAHHATPVILYDFPPLLSQTKYCGFTKLSKDAECYNSIETILRHQKLTRAVIGELKLLYPKIVVIDPLRIICPDGRCQTKLSNLPLYYDFGGGKAHLNYFGSLHIGHEYLNRFGNPFKSIVD